MSDGQDIHTVAFAERVRANQQRLNAELALQLQLIECSESMGDHDSGSDDWWCVG